MALAIVILSGLIFFLCAISCLFDFDQLVDKVHKDELDKLDDK